MQPFSDPVHTYLRTTYGTPQAVVPLHGLSHAQVWRVRFHDHSVIIKRTSTHTEALFYRTVAPYLRENGIPIPLLAWSAEASAGDWLILEDIPLPFPQTRWLADAEQLAILRRLHDLPLEGVHDRAPLFAPRWTAAMTEAALACFPRSTSAHLRPILDIMRSAAQALFHPACLISGDPNPKNWGLRRNGMLALFDWERFGCATSAIDVAITVPGLGDSTAFQRVASTYLKAADPAQVAAFAQDLALAKVWSVVELLAELHTQAVLADDTRAYLRENVPAWLHTIGTAYR